MCDRALTSQGALDSRHQPPASTIGALCAILGSRVRVRSTVTPEMLQRLESLQLSVVI